MLPQKPLRVALGQMTSTDDCLFNQKQLLNLLQQVPAGTDLVGFPENALFFRIESGSTIQPLDLNDNFWSELQMHSVQNQRTILLTTPVRKENGQVVNGTILIDPAQTAPKLIYEKIHLFDVDVAGHPSVRESDHFASGNKPSVTKVLDWDLGLSICYDLRFPELYLNYARQGIPVLWVPSAFLVPTGQAHWHVLLRARAIEAQAYVLAPAQSGRHEGEKGGERFTFGHSLVVSPWGEIIQELTSEGPGILLAELDPLKVRQVREQIPMSQHRRLN